MGKDIMAVGIIAAVVVTALAITVLLFSTDYESVCQEKGFEHGAVNDWCIFESRPWDDNAYMCWNGSFDIGSVEMVESGRGKCFDNKQ